MPVSKHRRKNKNRKRPRHVAQPVAAPPPSAPWVPRVGVGLLGLGVLVIILSYVPAVRNASFLNSLPWIGANWGLVLGFISLTAGFGVLTKWR